MYSGVPPPGAEQPDRNADDRCERRRGKGVSRSSLRSSGSFSEMERLKSKH